MAGAIAQGSTLCCCPISVSRMASGSAAARASADCVIHGVERPSMISVGAGISAIRSTGIVRSPTNTASYTNV